MNIEMLDTILQIMKHVTMVKFLTRLKNKKHLLLLFYNSSDFYIFLII